MRHTIRRGHRPADGRWVKSGLDKLSLSLCWSPPVGVSDLSEDMPGLREDGSNALRNCVANTASGFLVLCAGLLRAAAFPLSTFKPSC